MWFLKGSKFNILVDLGPPDPDWSFKYHNLEIIKEKGLSEVLHTIGISSESVKIIIMTHLHWDHCFGAEEFKNAKFIVQRSELQYAIAPLPAQAAMYEIQLDSPPFFKFFNKIEVVDGDEEIEPGIEVIHLPGHTPGSQGVKIRTKKGIYFIAGDTVGLFENLEYSPFIPSGIFVDLEASYRSLKKLKDQADYILPSHDMRVFEKKIYP
jgi:glyoxylase-like metal-dependent hydrolase (beta-lactamase superfamily II)